MTSGQSNSTFTSIDRGTNEEMSPENIHRKDGSLVTSVGMELKLICHFKTDKIPDCSLNFVNNFDM